MMDDMVFSQIQTRRKGRPTVRLAFQDLSIGVPFEFDDRLLLKLNNEQAVVLGLAIAEIINMPAVAHCVNVSVTIEWSTP
jgi:hypothetical protein